MRLKLDENLPAALVEKLSGLGHDVDTVPAEDLRGHPHLDIWEATHGRTTRTKIKLRRKTNSGDPGCLSRAMRFLQSPHPTRATPAKLRSRKERRDQLAQPPPMLRLRSGIGTRSER
jgi:Domain of unknown function (DUF5615)